MLLADLVAASADVRATPSRSAKVGRLAALLRALAPEEVPIAVPYLSGDLRQGRIGLGGAALRDACGPWAAQVPALSLLDVDEAFSRIGAASGSGSARQRIGELAAANGVVLHELTAERATLEEVFLELTGDPGERGA